MYRFWQLDQGWVAAPRPNEATSLFCLMNEDDFGIFHDGEPISSEMAEEICAGKHPWFLIHSQGGELIGVIALLRGNEERAEVFIHMKKRWRGMGIGLQALDRLKKVAVLGMHLRELYVRVINTNVSALSFFQHCGFTEVKELPSSLWVPDVKLCIILKCSLRMEQIRLSVIVPMHNSNLWIQRCIDSLGAFPCEILLVDDNSDDQTPCLCQQMEQCDPRIRLIRLSSRGMAGAARNAGLREASGEYLMFLDSDDTVISTSILHKMAAYAAISHADCVLTCQYEKHYRSKIELVRLLSPFTGRITPDLRGKLYARQFPVWMAWYRKSFIYEHALYFPERVSYEDNYFSFVLASEVQSICSVPGVMVCHEIRSQSLSHIPDIQIQTSYFHVTDLCLVYIKHHDLYRRFPRELTFWYIYAVFFTGLHVWKTMFPKHDWIIRESMSRLKRFFPNLWEDHVDLYLPPSERETLRCAWEDIDAFILCEGINNNENI